MNPRQRPERAAATPPAAESDAGTWLRGIRLSGFALTVLALVVAALVVLAPSLKILVEQRATIAELEREQAKAQQSVEDLQHEVDRWSDPAFLKAQARDRLLYAFPGDITYLVIDDSPHTPTAPDGLPISDEIQSSRIDWVSAVLSSAMSAGLGDADPVDLLSPQSRTDR